MRSGPYYNAGNAQDLIPVLKAWKESNYVPTELNFAKGRIKAATMQIRLRCAASWLADNTKDDPATHAFWCEIEKRLRIRVMGAHILWLVPNEMDIAISMRALTPGTEENLLSSFEDWLASDPPPNARWPFAPLGFALEDRVLEHFRKRQRELDEGGKHFISTITPDRLTFVKVSEATWLQLQPQ